MTKPQAVFVDRDGTVGGTGHFIHPKDFTPYPFSQLALNMLREAGIRIFALTNQHRISRGEATVYDFEKEFTSLGFDDAFICPHSSQDECECHKPKPGLLLQAAQKHNIDLTKCVVIGDVGSTDMLAADAVGATKVLVRTGWGEPSLGKYRHTWGNVAVDNVANDLLDAVHWILWGIEADKHIQIRRMTENDTDFVFQGLLGYHIAKPRPYIEQCVHENGTGERVTFLAVYGGRFAGWAHFVLRPGYPFYAENGIPEVQNLDVIPPFRKRGIGSALMDRIEQFAFETHDVIGIGFGLYADYGAAQRMYVKRGYVPDGRGVMYDHQPVKPGTDVRMDDDLVLYFTKRKPK